jgi:HAD domain in Swiss Army Knife RNA repair proteins
MCVSNLNTLVEAANAEIVISSSWRTAHSLEFIRETLCLAGFRWPDRIVGMTEHLHYRVENGRVIGRAERRDEIVAWLTHNPRELFVILDDEFEAEIAGHFVRTPGDLGLGVEHVSRALSILRQPKQQ